MVILMQKKNSGTEFFFFFLRYYISSMIFFVADFDENMSSGLDVLTPFSPTHTHTQPEHSVHQWNLDLYK